MPLTIHVSIVNLRSEFHATNVRRTVDSTDRLSWQQEQQRDFRYFRYLDLSIMHCDSSAALSNVCSECWNNTLFVIVHCTVLYSILLISYDAAHNFVNHEFMAFCFVPLDIK